MKRTIKLLLYYFLYELGSFCFMMFVYALVNGLHSRAEGVEFSFPDSLSLPLTYTLIANVIGSSLYAFHLISKHYVPVGRRTFSPYSPVLIILVMVLAFSTMVWTNYLTELTQLPNDMEETFQQMGQNVWGVLSIVIIAPVLEELLFRGAIESHLLQVWKNPWGGILVSAFIFGAIHGNPAQIPFAMLLGILLGWLYYRTGSLILCMLFHFLNNATSVILMHLFPERATMQALLGDSAILWASAATLILTAFSIWMIRQFTFPIRWEKEMKGK